MGSILSGCRVLDLTDEKGMLCSRLLADMGADVNMVENPGRSRVSRRSNRFRYLNAGKRSIVLDLTEPSGSQAFKALVRRADVLVESHQPGYMDSLGVGYPALSKINPRLVMASITGFGQNGPYRDYKVTDIVASATGGWMYPTGESDTPPLKLFGQQAYNSASLFAANGIMLALLARHTTRKGQHIDVSIMECVAGTLDHVLVRRFYERNIARRQGSLYWNCAFRVFPCCDGYILLSIHHQWDTLVEWLASEGMAADLTDPKWRDRDTRIRHIDHIIAVLENWTLSHTVDELVDRGQLMRFPWGRVNLIPDFVASPQLAERHFFAGKFPGPPCRLSLSPWQTGGKVPAKGEHNEAVFREFGVSSR